MEKWQYKRAYYSVKIVKEREKWNLHAQKRRIPYLEIIESGKKLVYEEENVELKINEMGRDGWEMFSTTPMIGEKNIPENKWTAVTLSDTKEVTTEGITLWFKKKIV